MQYRADPAYPAYHSCSNACDVGLLRLMLAGKGFIAMAELTGMEAQAIKDARPALWASVEAVLGHDLALAMFDGLDPAQVDAIIRSVWDGVRASMQQQSARGEVPF